MTRRFNNYKAMVKFFNSEDAKNFDIVGWKEKGKGYVVEYSKAIFRIQLGKITVYADTFEEAKKIQMELLPLGKAEIVRF